MSLIKKSVTISGHATSVTMEPEFWDVLTRIAKARGLSVSALIREVDASTSHNPNRNLSSALRVFILTSVTGS
jgi:predicted DNA-binding ribbon-helix-helix protein